MFRRCLRTGESTPPFAEISKSSFFNAVPDRYILFTRSILSGTGAAEERGCSIDEVLIVPRPMCLAITDLNTFLVHYFVNAYLTTSQGNWLSHFVNGRLQYLTVFFGGGARVKPCWTHRKKSVL